VANYIVNYTKKLKTLRRKEQELRRLVNCGADREELVRVAVDVRDARVRVLLARLAKLPPKENSAEAIATIEQEIGLVGLQSPESILAEF
jgi:hypothetical protein